MSELAVAWRRLPAAARAIAVLVTEGYYYIESPLLGVLLLLVVLWRLRPQPEAQSMAV